SPSGNEPHFYSSNGNGDTNGHDNGNGNGNGHLHLGRHAVPAPAAMKLATVSTATLPAATGQTATATVSAPAAQLDTKKAIAADVDDDGLDVKVPRRRRMPSLVPATVRTAINALRRNKMRSALTTLGIVIGVGAVIAMVEISQGSKTALMRTMSTMGANN